MISRVRRGVLVALALCPALAAPAHAQTAPINVAAAAQGVSSITWTWTDVPDVNTTGYDVFTSTNGDLSGPLPTSATTFTWVGLSTDTSNAVYIKATGAVPANSATVAAFTLAAQPSGSALLSGNLNSVTMSWLSNGNPPGTLYEIDWFVAGSTPIVFSTQPVVAAGSATATINDLPGGTSVFFEVQAVNSAGVPTPFDVTLGTAIPAIANQPVISSGTFALGISSISWFWSASTGAINYQLFEESGVAVSPLLGPLQLNVAQTGLTPNTLYSDYIEAFGTGSSTNSAAFSRYTLAAPTTGLTLASLSTATATETIVWGPNGNAPNTVYQVEWWTALTSTVTVSVPTTSATISGLPGGSTIYFTIQAMNGDGILSAFDATLGGPVVNYSTHMPVGIANLPPTFSGTLTYVLPNSVVTVLVATGTFASAVNFTVSTAPPSAFPPTGAGQTQVAPPITFVVNATDAFGVQQTPLKPLLIGVQYPLGGLAPLTPDDASLTRFDATHGIWSTLATSRSFSAATLSAVSTGLGMFQVLGIAAPADLSSITVGPNPLRPMVNPGSLMTFRNLPPSARVRIFTYIGEKLVEIAADNTGVAAWDGRNAAGSWVASGVYIAVIQGGGVKKLMRVAIER